jgi:cytochrome b
MTLNSDATYHHAPGGSIPIFVQKGLRFLAETAAGTNETHADDDHVFGTEGGELSDDGHSGFGVHITYEQLYSSVMFMVCVYISGQIASRLFKMPDLVGEIIAGILLGPNLGAWHKVSAIY